MLSVKSYFNKSLFRGALGRTWPLWAAYTLVWVLMMPVYLFTMLNGYHVAFSRITTAYDALQMSINGGIAAAAFSGICFAMAMFAYLSNSRATCGLHTMPIRREGLFLSHYLAGLFAQAVTLVFAFALAALVTAGHGVFDAYALGMGLIINLLLVVFFYSFGVLCMVCAGQVLAGAAFYGVFNFLFITMEALVQTFAGNFLYGYSHFSDSFITMLLSPLFQLYSRLGVSKVWPETADGGILWDAEPIGVTVDNFRYVPLYALAGVVLAVIALVLYRSRKSEATGSTVAVTWLRPVFKYGVALCAAFSFGQLLSYFVFELSNSPYETGALVGTIACMVFAGLLGYYAAEMLLKKSFGVFKTSWKGALATALALVLIGVSFPLDLTGYQSYVPEQSEIESAQINIYTGGNIHNYFELDDAESIALLRDAHYACTLDKTRQTSVNRYEPKEHYCDLNIRYSLTDGTEVWRRYDLTLDPAQLADPSSPESAITALVSCGAITQQRILGGKLPENWENVRVTGGYVDCRYYPNGEYDRSDEAELDAIQANNVFIALMQDCVEGNVETATIFGENEIGAEPTTKPGIPDEYYIDVDLWYFDSSRADESSTVVVEYDKYGAEIDYNASINTRVTPEMTATIQTLRELNVIEIPMFK